MSALAERLTQTRLAEAWRRARRSPGPGVDGVHGGRFERGLASRLAELRRDMLTGAYQPSPLLRRVRAKPDGGERVLGIPTLRDRVAQCAVLLSVGDLDGRLLPEVHGYRPGRSPATAIRHLLAQVGLREHLEVVQADIHGMFDNLEHGRLSQALAWSDPLWMDLCRRWIAAWAASPGRGVPQGAPLSPLLANLYMARHLDPMLSCCDAAISGNKGVTYNNGRTRTPASALAAARAVIHRHLLGASTAPRREPPTGDELVAWIRYGDDLVLVSARRGGGLALLRRLDALVRAAGLELGDRKTTTASSRAGLPLPRPVLGARLLFERVATGWRLSVSGALPAAFPSQLPWEDMP